ncbi:hypothetical protein CC1G_15170 [Coprinopsis cinerea okayama7|uniref:Uncharacterized protein n=1 Tax=Coprinopsis cinerea (strain Okayama-7 / 130 / ATCC MYA-4618 / FGSC 9003) TaxID=240176 RepID=D6RPH9_COPC7|nr:hypothetical protein CC1G_15170 [Coprinopsis cinerea okayama7\|eukprot:XP_002910531.1 hypothetical protein CC1G_15170 [Coprinopsis cinerea okayama7\
MATALHHSILTSAGSPEEHSLRTRNRRAQLTATSSSDNVPLEVSVIILLCQELSDTFAKLEFEFIREGGDLEETVGPYRSPDQGAYRVIGRDDPEKTNHSIGRRAVVGFGSLLLKILFTLTPTNHGLQILD